MKKISLPLFILILTFALFLAACQPAADETVAEESAAAGDSAAQPMMGGMMGPGGGMMGRHHATIPDDYAGLTNPVSPDEESVARGAETFTRYCVPCHGETGAGDGPSAAGLDPQPAPLNHTVRMLADDYLFWRISEGGSKAPFNSVMPSWKAALDEGARWDLINYLRVLSGGQPAPGPFDPQAEAERRAEMLAQAEDQGLITAEEAALFETVHAQLDALMTAGNQGMGMMNQEPNQADLLTQLIEDGIITTEEAEAFNVIHDRLLTAGLMQ